MQSQALNEIEIKVDNIKLLGNLNIPLGAKRIVLFAHGSGSSRLSPRNQYVAAVLNKEGIATVLLDLLTKEEEIVDYQTARLRFDVIFLANRLQQATDWVKRFTPAKNLSVGYFGASTGAAAALIAAAKQPALIKAVVSRGGRPDLAQGVLESISVPTLFIVGGNDTVVLDLNKLAFEKLKGIKKLEVIPHATHLFEEPDALDKVSKLAARWFISYLV